MWRTTTNAQEWEADIEKERGREIERAWWPRVGNRIHDQNDRWKCYSFGWKSSSIPFWLLLSAHPRKSCENTPPEISSYFQSTFPVSLSLSLCTTIKERISQLWAMATELSLYKYTIFFIYFLWLFHPKNSTIKIALLRVDLCSCWWHK